MADLSRVHQNEAKEASQGTLASKKEGVLDRKENKLNSLSFQTKRKWRNDGYRPYAEMLVNFFCISGASRSVLAMHFKLINISKGLDECLWRQVQFRRYLHGNKLNLESSRRQPKDLINDTEKWGNLPQKKCFSVSSEPSCSKTPETASDNSVIPLNLFGVAWRCKSNVVCLCISLQHSRPSTQ